jgi:hypothetical protein
VDWTVFASLTFREEQREARAIVAAEKLLKWVSHITEVKYRMLSYVIRLENGERTGRLHLHMLIVVERRFSGYFVVAEGRASQAYQFWKKAYGISRFRAVESGGDSAVAYMTKDMDAGADNYELAKTARSQHLYISPEALKCIRKRIGSADTSDERTSTLAQSQSSYESVRTMSPGIAFANALA